eukprot:CAMPEP_0178399912 /NCGR_PEP_ID=MMETSP0689_2-20121128/15520_1 /TAXON_ID=160604 /ORGANISM="Amphidinium massartii, Strain CS-259" /LENGTH=665 /DNA_ID=CAMNT_0020020695 /DNA_START=76 /DNA_END=2070 /DNA_ORIENTATION=-
MARSACGGSKRKIDFISSQHTAKRRRFWLQALTVCFLWAGSQRLLLTFLNPGDASVKSADRRSLRAFSNRHVAPNQRQARSLIQRAAAGSADGMKPLLTVPLQRLDLGENAVGEGYDLVDVQLLTKTGEPMAATFMLDSGLTSNLITPEFKRRAGLPPSQERVEGAGLGGVSVVENTLLPGLELLGDESEEEGEKEIFQGVWAGEGWRALCTLDWDSWVSTSKKQGSKELKGVQVKYKVLPTDSLEEKQLDTLIGIQGTETVDGSLETGPDGALKFVGKGVAVVPEGFLAKTPRYEFIAQGDELVEAVSGMRLRRKKAARKGVPLPGPLMAAEVPFPQVQLADKQGIDLVGMLGQWPLHTVCALYVDRAASELKIFKNQDASAVAEQAGLVRIPGQELPSGLFGVELQHMPLAVCPGWGDSSEMLSAKVSAMVDSGSSYSIMNWAAAKLMFGLTANDKVVQEAPKVRGIGVSGGQLDFPLVQLSLGLAASSTGKEGIQLGTVSVAIGDAPIFDQLFGREEEGLMGFFGQGKPKPGALIGQDLLSQQRYMLASAEPAVYLDGEVQEAGKSGSFSYIGEGDCTNADGQRLQGLQKIACTPDDAAAACLSLPPGTCHGIAVTPSGTFQGLCYIFVEETEPKELQEKLKKKGFRRYEAPSGQTLASRGA